jgi:acetoacetyl-CoA reductase
MLRNIAIVTGGTRGIGRAISLALQKDGYEVIANYSYNDLKAQEFSFQSNIAIKKWDVSDFNSCKENIETIINQYKSPISILVNNAGISRDGMLHKLEEDKWLEVINVNLNSCFNMCRAVINHMRENNYGRIINISSINAITGGIGAVNYSAAKAGMLGLTKALAKESANKGVTVNAVAPGYVNTELLSNVSEKIMENIIKQIPVRD